MKLVGVVTIVEFLNTNGGVEVEEMELILLVNVVTELPQNVDEDGKVGAGAGLVIGIGAAGVLEDDVTLALVEIVVGGAGLRVVTDQVLLEIFGELVGETSMLLFFVGVMVLTDVVQLVVSVTLVDGLVGVISFVEFVGVFGLIAVVDLTGVVGLKGMVDLVGLLKQ